MLKAAAKTSFLLRLGAWVFTCMRAEHLPEALHDSIRPLQLFGFACWCDRADTGR